jgi:DNA repair ATPase RecN
MKKLNLIIAGIGCMTGLLLTSCQSKEQKVENAREDVIDANADLRKAQMEYREAQEDKLRENDRMLEDYRTRAAEQKAEMREDYNTRVNELERRNKEMRTRLDTYNDNDNDNTKWESFKREFNHDMEELGNSFRDIGKNNVK